MNTPSAKEKQSASLVQLAPSVRSRAAYRSWVALQVAHVARICSFFLGLFVLASYAKVFFTQHASSKDSLMDASTLTLILLPNLMSFILLSRPQRAEACFIGTGLTRSLLAFAVGFGFLPPTDTFERIMHFHIEKVIELGFVATVEQVSMRWAVLLRGLLAIGYWMVYKVHNKPNPLLTSLSVNGLALLIQALMDSRYKLLYRRAMHCHGPALGASTPSVTVDGPSSPTTTINDGAPHTSCLKAKHVSLSSLFIPSSSFLTASSDSKHSVTAMAHPSSSHLSNKPTSVSSLSIPSSSLTASSDLSALSQGAISQVWNSPRPSCQPALQHAAALRSPQPQAMKPQQQQQPPLPQPLIPQAHDMQLAHPVTTQLPGQRAESVWLPPDGGLKRPSEAETHAGMTGMQAAQADPETLETLKYLQKCLQKRRPKYTTFCRKYKISLKVPCSPTPDSLAPDALVDLSSMIHLRQPNVQLLSAITRAECILVVADLREASRYLTSDGNGKQDRSLGKSLADAAWQWLSDTGLASELVADSTVSLQVDRELLMCRVTSEGRWDVQPALPVPPSYEQCSITAAVPALLLPGPLQPSTGTGCVQQGTNSIARSNADTTSSCIDSNIDGEGTTCASDSTGSKGNDAASSPSVEVCACVRVPPGAVLQGWTGPAPHSNSATEGAGAVPLRVMACTSTGYVPTRLASASRQAAPNSDSLSNCTGAACLSVADLRRISSDGTDSGRSSQCPSSVLGLDLYEVTVQLPPNIHQAMPSSSPCLLRLELWHSHTLLDHSSLLLLPSGLSQAATELKALPWNQEECEDVASFVVDLGHFFELHDPLAKHGCDVSAGLGAGKVASMAVAQVASARATASDKDAAAAPADGAGIEAPAAQVAAARASLKGAGASTSVSTPVAKVSTATEPTGKESLTAWHTGQTLLRQAVLWGCPGLADTLLEVMLSLPSRPPAPFAALAHAPSIETGRRGCSLGPAPAQASSSSSHSSANASLLPGEDEKACSIDQLGDLLHLALLSPNPLLMLPAALSWARRFGNLGVGQAVVSVANFAWRWDEPNALGLTPLNILLGLEESIQLLQVLLNDPAGGFAMLQDAARLSDLRCQPHPSTSESMRKVCSSQLEDSCVSVTPCGSMELKRGQFSECSSVEQQTQQQQQQQRQGKTLLAHVQSQQEQQQKVQQQLLPSNVASEIEGACVKEVKEVTGAPTKSGTNLLQSCPPRESHWFTLKAQAFDWSQRTVKCCKLVLASLLCSQPRFEQAVGSPPAQVKCQDPAQGSHSSSSIRSSSVRPACDDAGFRLWADVQSAPILRAWSMCLVFCIIINGIRAIIAGGWEALCSEIPSQLGMGVPYTVASLFTTPARVQSMIMLVMTGRLIMTSLVGMRLVYVPLSFEIVRVTRLEFLLEVFVSGTMEQTRTPVLLMFRALLVIGYHQLYSGWVYPRAWLQALILQGCAFTVSVVTDLSYRFLYSKRAARLAAAATAAGTQAKA